MQLICHSVTNVLFGGNVAGGRWHKEGYGQRAVVSSVSHPPSVISVSVCMTHIPDPPFYLKMSFKIR